MFLSPPQGGSFKWQIRRWMAVKAFQMLCLQTIVVLIAAVFAVVRDTQNGAGILMAFATAVSPSALALAGVVAKYMHDVRVADASEDRRLTEREPT